MQIASPNISPKTFNLLAIAASIGESFSKHLLTGFYKNEKVDVEIQEALQQRLIAYLYPNSDVPTEYYRFTNKDTHRYFYDNIQEINDIDLLKRMVFWQSKQTRQSDKQLRKYYKKHTRGIKILHDLTMHPSILNGVWNESLPLLTKNLSKLVSVATVSIWRYDEDTPFIQCLDLYNSYTQTHSVPETYTLYEKDFPHYFDLLKKGNIITANNARNDTATYELNDDYLEPMGVYALMDIPFFIEGKLAGVICFEHDFPKVWTPDEILSATTISLFLSLTYHTLQRKRSEDMLKEMNEHLMGLNTELTNQHEEIHVQAELIYTQNQDLQLAYKDIKDINENLERIIEQRTQTLHYTNEQLNTINSELDTFLYHSSHDLRRPLTTLMGLVEVGKLQMSKPSSLQLLNYIYTTVKDMDRMLQKLINISEINGDYSNFRRIDFKDIIAKVVDNFTDVVSTKNISVYQEIEPFIHWESYVEIVASIIFNLFENAVIFANNQEPFIKISAKQDAKNVYIEITDNGIGIDQAYQSRIFNMFFRASEKSIGNGLGLYVAKKAVEKLNGNIEFVSKSHQGAKFTVIFPNNMATKVNY
jgi:signal transduction histidine kinase